MLENAMVIKPYYSPSQAAFAERADELLCDGLNCRNFEWTDRCDTKDALIDLASRVLKAKSSEEAGVEAYRVLEAVIEAWAEEAAKEEE